MIGPIVYHQQVHLTKLNKTQILSICYHLLPMVKDNLKYLRNKVLELVLLLRLPLMRRCIKDNLLMKVFLIKLMIKREILQAIQISLDLTTKCLQDSLTYSYKIL